MDREKLKILGALNHIKENPGCNTKTGSLDANLARDLLDADLINAFDMTPIRSEKPVIIAIKLNISGEKYRSKLERETRPSSPLTNWVLTIIGAVIAASITYYLGF